METPSAEASSASAKVTGGGDTGAPWGAATAPPAKENTRQGLPDEPWALTMQFCVLETSASPSPSAPSFPFVLWKLVCCFQFKSIWWGNHGSCIVIAEKLFQKEVLGRRGAWKIFEAKTMSSFLAQLHLRGFCRMEEDMVIDTPIKEPQAVAAAGPALGQLLFYHHPYFQRDYPNLLQMEMMAESAGEPLLPPRSQCAGHPWEKTPTWC